MIDELTDYELGMAFIFGSAFFTIAGYVLGTLLALGSSVDPLAAGAIGAGATNGLMNTTTIWITQ